MQRFLGDFVFLFTVIDPIGTAPVFIAATAGMSDRTRRLIAVRAAVISAALLVACVVVGQAVLEHLDIDFAAFRVAGGVILFLFALDMIFGESKPEHEVAEANKHAEDDLDAAVYPLAIPSIAGPGAIMAAILLTDNSQFSLAEQSLTALAILLVLALTFLTMLAATRIHRLIGQVGASIISRVMGMLFAAMAADGVLSGVRDFFLI
ncbi:MAG: MarC family protein [Phycisphaerales bacterium JB058]